jgi:hypothetical protein
MYRSIAWVLAAALLLGLPAAAKQPGDQGHGHGHGPDRGSYHGPAHHEGGGHFDAHQREGVHAWYVAQYGSGGCPPGLAKKHNGCLPPGQAKKRYAVGHTLPADIRWSPPPPSLSARLGPAPRGYLYVTLDGDLLKLAVGTMLVVDAVQGLVN